MLRVGRHLGAGGQHRLQEGLDAFGVSLNQPRVHRQAGSGARSRLARAAHALTPLVGEYATGLFAVGLFNASLFAACVLPLSTSYYICEGMGWELGVDKDFREAPQFFWLFTLLIAVSAAIILLAGPVEGTGVSLVQNALTAEVGGWGKYFLAIVVLFFAFTSIVANYFYAENCLVFLEHNHPAGLLAFRVLVLVMVLFGAVGSLPFVWNFADVAMGLMAITNLVAILLLSGLVVKLAKDYNAQRAAGKLPTFDARDYPEIRSRLEPGIWD